MNFALILNSTLASVLTRMLFAWLDARRSIRELEELNSLDAQQLRDLGVSHPAALNAPRCACCA